MLLEWRQTGSLSFIILGALSRGKVGIIMEVIAVILNSHLVFLIQAFGQRLHTLLL